MINYVKVRLYNKLNNTFAANGVLLKKVSSETPNIASWRFVYKRGTLPFSPTMGGNTSITLDELTFTLSSGRLDCVVLSTGNSMDSFETFMIGNRMDHTSVFNNYRVILGDDVFDSQGGVFSVDFDDLFVVEAREEFVSSGILIKAAYTQNVMYSGFAGYHHHPERGHFNTPIENDKPYRIGVELEVYANNRDAYNKITGSRTNWFMCERDGSLTERDFPIEIKTIPLRPVDATSPDFWNEPLTKLGQLAQSKNFHTTGLHVHISKEILGSNEPERQKNLSKLCMFYTYYIEDDPEAHQKNVIICGREQGYAGTLDEAKSELGNFAKVLGLSVVQNNETAFNMMADTVKGRINNQRWDINTGRWNTYGTIEFRKGDGAISKTRMAALCTWWEQMCLYCKNTHPRDFSFNDFFNKVCREYPCVAYYFQMDEER